MLRSRRTRSSHGHDLALAFLGARSAREVWLTSVIDTHIHRVLDAADGNLSLAAKVLKMHRRSLQRYLRRKRR